VHELLDDAARRAEAAVAAQAVAVDSAVAVAGSAIVFR